MIELPYWLFLIIIMALSSSVLVIIVLGREIYRWVNLCLEWKKINDRIVDKWCALIEKRGKDEI